MKHLFNLHRDARGQIHTFHGPNNWDSPLYQFADHFHDYLFGAAQQAKAEDHDATTAFKLETPDHTIYLLPGNLELSGHGHGDVAIIAAKDENKGYIVLWGETMKGNLNRGILDFRLPIDAAEDDIRENFQQASTGIANLGLKWTEFFEELERQHPKFRDLNAALIARLTPCPAKELCEKYLFPVESLNLKTPDYYQPELGKKLFP
ncbi:MAG: hypothetical protein H6867_03795 [Rhodospirillales bacterium]|nr:hypothetical protein [Rhodospirillales bacterium]MCB9996273.1 hypothetical protein [Rhodospirillales bacterium]